MFVAIEYIYNDREEKAIFPELNAVYGPFQDQQTAEKWVKEQPSGSGWCRYEYQIKGMYIPPTV